jgi:transcriptional regulator with XRE-family HTH domain
MSDGKALDDVLGRPGMNRRPSVGIRCRLADNLKRYRHCRGYTQRTLANLCGLSTSYVSDVEQATVNITLANLEALATGLVCGEEELLRRQLVLPASR